MSLVLYVKPDQYRHHQLALRKLFGRDMYSAYINYQPLNKQCGARRARRDGGHPRCHRPRVFYRRENGSIIFLIMSFLFFSAHRHHASILSHIKKNRIS